MQKDKDPEHKINMSQHLKSENESTVGVPVYDSIK